MPFIIFLQLGPSAPRKRGATVHASIFHIRALRHIRPILSEGTANLIASALVSSRLDYANACLFGISNKNLSLIQRIQNTLARVVTFSRSRCSIAPLLKHLHWIPVSARIHFKIALLTFK